MKESVSGAASRIGFEPLVCSGGDGQTDEVRQGYLREQLTEVNTIKETQLPTYGKKNALEAFRHFVYSPQKMLVVNPPEKRLKL